MSRAERFVALVALLALSLVALFNRGGEWRGEWNWSFAYAMGTTILTGPVVAAIAAWLAWNRSALRAITDMTPRGWLVAARWAVEAWALGLVTLVTVTIVATVTTLLVPHGGPVDPLAFVEAPVLLAAYAAMGAAGGRIFPHPVTAVLMAPLTFLVAMVGSKHVTFDFLRATIPPTGSVAGGRWSGLSVLGAAAGLGGLTCLLLAVIFETRWRRLAQPALAACGVALFVGSMVVSHTHGTDAFEPSAESATSCAGAEPVVCVMPSHIGALPAFAPEVDRLAQYLRRARTAVPDRFEESFWGVTDPSVGGFYLNDGARTDADPGIAAHVLATPSDCPAYRSDIGPPDVAFTARDLIASWILHQAGEPADTDGGREDAWLRSPQEVQAAAWVAKTYAQLAACDLRRLRVPWAKAQQ